jgi:secretion/DNA translocation related CpaE-like protein
VIGVVGGCGGVGASTFAAVLALVAAPALLVDLDVNGGGVDVVLGVEQASGARWSGLRLEGGRLDPAALAEGLPRAGPVPVLAADTAALDPAAVLQVLDAAGALGVVVLDLPRAACPEREAGLLRCDLVVVVARADVAGLVAAHATVSALPELPVGVVVRRGGVEAAGAARLVGAPLLGVLPALAGGPLTIDPARPPRSIARVAAGVLTGLEARTVA